MVTSIAAPSALELTVTSASRRNAAIDILRGFVMVLMALDHARDFATGFDNDPTELATTSFPLFFTRWVTHYCAPVFVFLAGLSAHVAGQRRTKLELARFLASRGLWLVVLELTVVRFCWLLDVSYQFSVLQVIWAIGVSMLVLSGLVLLPRAVPALVGLVMIAGHNVLDGVHFEHWLWKVLHESALLQSDAGRRLFVAYPLIPWVGVMAVGYAAGALWQRPDRKRVFAYIGAALTVLFLVLRAGNFYGDPAPWSVQPRDGFTLLSFLRVSKYPPSLLYLAVTLGPSLLVLSALDGRAVGPVGRVLAIYGRVPLFYYVLHLLIAHLVVFAGCGSRLLDATFRAQLSDSGPPGWGLGEAYLVWLVTVVVLYPLCRWYGGVKARSRSEWFSYL